MRNARIRIRRDSRRGRARAVGVIVLQSLKPLSQVEYANIMEQFKKLTIDENGLIKVFVNSPDVTFRAYAL